MMLVLMFLLFVACYCSIIDQLSPQYRHHVQQVSRCRAFCIDGMNGDRPINDLQCQQHSVCNQCWETCLLFSDNFPIWGFMCDKKDICFDGCQIACQIYKSKHSEQIMHQMRFPAPLMVEKLKSDSELLVQWKRPLIDDQSPSFSIVYFLFWREANSSVWIPLFETIELAFWTRNAQIVHFVDDLLLLVITRDGLSAAQSWKEPVDFLFTNNTVSSDNSHLWWSATLFIFGATVTSFLCGLMITLACLVIHRALQSWKRKRTLTRGLAFRHYPKLRSLNLSKRSHPEEKSELSTALLSVLPISSEPSPAPTPRPNRPASLDLTIPTSSVVPENFYTSTPQFEETFWNRIESFSKFDRRMSETYTLTESSSVMLVEEHKSETFVIKHKDIKKQLGKQKSALL